VTPQITRGAMLALALLAVATEAAAHGRSLSYSSWQLDRRGAHVEARLTAIDLATVPDLLTSGAESEQRVAAYLAEHLRLLSDGAPCPPTSPPRAQSSSAGWMVYAWDVACPQGERRSIASDLLLAQNPTHMHFTRVELPGGKTAERVLSETEPRWEVPTVVPRTAANAASPSSALDDVKSGMLSLLTGWAPLAFLLGLLLFARTTADVAVLLVSFGVAHSLALLGGALGLVAPEPRATASVVGFSIALVAIENAWLAARRSRAMALAIVVGLATLVAFGVARSSALAPLAIVGLAGFALCHAALLGRAAQPTRVYAGAAFAFGLVHGFAFAGVFAGLEVPRARLVAALIGFNAGIEIAELTVVLLAWPILRAASRLGSGRAEAAIAESLSAALCGLGLYWFVVQAFG
jgi:HupE/UreJ protein